MTADTLRTVQVGANAITYDRHGDTANPTVVLLSGWCQDHRLFDPLLPHLISDFDVVRIDWRGHGLDRTPVPDFGPAEQATDTLAVLDALGVERFLPLSTSHGGWANIEIAERAGLARVASVLVIDWIMTAASPEFLASLDAGADPDTWQQGRDGLFDIWLDGSDNAAVRNHVRNEMAAFDYEMWARSCRVIKTAYQHWGSPLERMAAMSEQPSIKHLFSQPTTADYARAQEDFESSHPWFSYRNLGGPTHFPTLDSPEPVAEEIRSAHARLG
ncbi:alpha/beta fold hydrolase [Nocardia sp. NPDC056000]|uniref:alpha/beta fold hydrolase n=1 Tax=Nocardia sp. NPDC056000 TaxID=3345674 RepID=UPI0035DCC684